MPNGVRIDPANGVLLGPSTWAAIVDALPRNLRLRARNRQRAEYQRFVEAVIWIAWVDSPWEQLPPGCGRWRSVYARFLRWNQRGLWQAIALHIGDEAGPNLLRLANETRKARPRLPLRPLLSRTTTAACPIPPGHGAEHSSPEDAHV